MVKVYFTTIGYANNYLGQIKADLQGRLRVTEVNVHECDVIVAICTIVSRVGTDVEAALREIPDSKPVVLLVLHHTFDKDYIVPDTQRYMGQRGQTVDLLFHEDQGLLYCRANEEAKEKTLDLLSQYEPELWHGQWAGPAFLNWPSNPEGYSINARLFQRNTLVLFLLALLVIIVIVLLIYFLIHRGTHKN